MQNNRSDPSAVPENPKLSEQALLKRSISNAAFSLCSALFVTCLSRTRGCGNTWLRNKFLSSDTGHLR